MLDKTNLLISNETNPPRSPTEVKRRWEAIAVVLLNSDNRTATIEEIADEINRRNLYQRKDGQDLTVFQVMMRAKLSDGKYSGWFNWIPPNSVSLK